MNQFKPSLLILGTRGVPASHGGFETFAEKLALYLVERGWHVGVYCQDEVETVTQEVRSETWRGIECIHVQVASSGPRATLEFDWKCVRDAAKRTGVCLVLGYNGAIFLPYLRAKGRPIITNMDGIEWKRAKWSLPVKTWFWINEWIGAWSSHRLVADHPAIADHLATRRSRKAAVMIPYGGVAVKEAPEDPVRHLGLVPGNYLISIARIEPDNNILTLVEAFSRRRRNARLVVLGTFVEGNAYHQAILDAASDEVLFPGAIYDAGAVQALRFHARAYVHGHTVGGTNPSLVEALAAGNMVIAHDNRYNRWTASDAALYFTDADACERCFDVALQDDALVATCQAAARDRARSTFQWDDILATYEQEFLALAARRSVSAATVDKTQPVAE
jgi:glycosyltransferase involved in cell wall biosynthesis